MTNDRTSRQPPVRPEVSLEAYLGLRGAEIGVSDWLEVDQARIDAFADITMDWQAIHVDPAAAAASPFGTTVAHGFLTLSLLSALGSQIMPRISGTTIRLNYGLDRVRFVRPVSSGKRIRGRFTLAEVKERGDGDYLSSVDVVVEIEGSDQPALIARSLILARRWSGAPSG